MGGNISSTPWRNVKGIEWTEKWKKELYEKVRTIQLQDTESSPRIGLLVIGPSKHGKSSFINSLATVSKKEKSEVANSGSDGKSITAMYRQYTCPGDLKNFWLGDVRGLTKSSFSDGFVSDIKTLLAGHIKPGYKFIQEHQMRRKSKFYVPKPEASDKFYGVIIIYSSEHTREIHPEYQAGVKNISSLMHDMNMPRCVVLTKCDLLCEDTAKDISNIFNSKKVMTAVEKVSLGLGVSKGNIHPVVSYEDDLEEDPKKSIPLLLALKAILNMAHDHAMQDQVYTETDDNDDVSESDKALKTENE